MRYAYALHASKTGHILIKRLCTINRVIAVRRPMCNYDCNLLETHRTVTAYGSWSSADSTVMAAAAAIAGNSRKPRKNYAVANSLKSIEIRIHNFIVQ